jgi:hypothetical protein
MSPAAPVVANGRIRGGWVRLQQAMQLYRQLAGTGLTLLWDESPLGRGRLLLSAT